MSKTSTTAILIGGGEIERRLSRALGQGTYAEKVALCVVEPGRALEYLETSVAPVEFSVILVDVGEVGPAFSKLIARVRLTAPGTPVIALGDAVDEPVSLAALQSGAHDLIDCADIDDAHLARSIWFAIERNRFQRQHSEELELAARKRELDDLHAMGGPPPLPVTHRSLGAAPLIERMPEEFDRLVIVYGEVLETLTGRNAADRDEALHRIADSLGSLGAGPRDAINLHKAVINARLESRSARETKAYVEEGRLLLLQLMGYLVSFYRSLSWGRAPTLRVSATGRRTAISPASSTETESQ